MLFVSLIGSAILFAVITPFGHRKPQQFGLAALCSLIGLVPAFLCFTSASLLLNVLLVFLISVASMRFNPRSRTYTSWCLAATALSYAIVGVPTWMDLYDLQRHAPMQSLEGRLSYETKHKEGDAKPVKENAYWAHEMEDRFDSWRTERRSLALRRLHENFFHEFANSPGFGVTRRLSLRRAIILPEIEPISLSPGSRGTVAPANENGRTFRPVGNFDDFHNESVVDFVNPRGFGYIRDRGHVVGFQPHRFSQMPELPEQTSWQITRLELVSLLKFNAPAVYLSDNLPRMDELNNAPTRPLDPFEIKALETVRDGQEMVEDWSQAHRLRLFGAIRAMKACLSCHHGEVSDLLGAFTYELHSAQ
jgi:hypothetical protein